MRKIVRECLPPPSRYTKPAFAMPAGACDSHSHVTPTTTWNLATDASYEPCPTPPRESRRMRSALGFDRGIVVQASAFGQDNSGVTEALRDDPVSLRGVIVSDESISDVEIERLHALGVRGMRFITSGLGGTVGTKAMVALGPRMAHFGWHAEVLPAAVQWPDLLPVLRKMPCKVVVDHLGYLPAGLADDDPSVLALYELVADHGAFVKLIGYRLSETRGGSALARRAQKLFCLAPDRMVWGTDWPHVGLSASVDAGVLLNDFAGWFDNDKDVLDRVLAANPAKLYQFQG